MLSFWGVKFYIHVYINGTHMNDSPALIEFQWNLGTEILV